MHLVSVLVNLANRGLPFFPFILNCCGAFGLNLLYEEAIGQCEQVLQQNPDDVDALYGMSCCYALQHKIDESLKYLALAINQQPEETKNRAKEDPEFDGIREHLIIYAIT
ncbi:TPR end-of-group domain-containing protein, partial [Pseudanabaena mucicola]